MLNFLVWGLGFLYIGVRQKIAFTLLGGNLIAYGWAHRFLTDCWLLSVYLIIGGHCAYMVYKECKKRPQDGAFTQLTFLGAYDE